MSTWISPAPELTMAGLGRPAIGRLVTAGVLPSLSVDSETAAAADMFTQLRMARAADPAITARDTLAMAITHGARAVGLDHRIGSLTPGKQADLILLHADAINIHPLSDPTSALVTAGHPGNVGTVLDSEAVQEWAIVDATISRDKFIDY